MITFPLDFFPHTHTGKSGGQVHGFSFLRKMVFTILSSREWNVMMQILPPSLSRSIISSRLSLKTSSSWFSSIRIAWRVPLCRMSSHSSHFHGNRMFNDLRQLPGSLYSFFLSCQTDMLGDIFCEFIFPVVRIIRYSSLSL